MVKNNISKDILAVDIAIKRALLKNNFYEFFKFFGVQ